MMSNDRKLIFEPPAPALLPEIPILDRVLLTGGTGFIGPVPGEESAGTDAREDPRSCQGFRRASGRQRLRAAMESMGPCAAGLMQMFEARVIPVCGDLGQPNLGLTQEAWEFLACEVDTVFHNGATVNYLFNYDRMRDANVLERTRS